MRKLVPESVRDRIDGMLDGLRSPGDGAPGPDAVKQPEREKAGKREAERQAETDPEAALRRARGRAFVRHARAVDAIFKAQAQDMAATPGQVRELHEARAGFDELRSHGSRDAEAVYKKNPDFAAAVASGDPDRAAPARRPLQLETEMRRNPDLRADRFVERFRELRQTGERQYAAGDYSGYRAARAEMGNMAKSLERDPQMESILAGRKKDLGIGIDSGRSLGQQLAFNHGIDLGMGRGLGL
jgi:hypothetical protein